MTYSQPWLLIHRKQQQHLDARGMNHSKFYEIQRTDQPLEHFFLYKKSVNKISFSGVDPAEQKSLTWSCSRQARPEPALADAEDAPVTKAGLRATATRTITRSFSITTAARTCSSGVSLTWMWTIALPSNVCTARACSAITNLARNIPEVADQPLKCQFGASTYIFLPDLTHTFLHETKTKFYVRIYLFAWARLCQDIYIP